MRQLALVIAVALVLTPGAPLIPILFLSQALNAVLLLPLLWFVYGICRDRELMGDYAIGRAGAAGALACIVLLTLCVGGLAVATLA